MLIKVVIVEISIFVHIHSLLVRLGNRSILYEMLSFVLNNHAYIIVFMIIHDGFMKFIG
jgi:hypothetical protein